MTGRRRSSAALVTATALLASAVTAAVAAPAGAAPGWQPPTAISSSSQGTFGTALDVSAAGHALAAWDEHSATTHSIMLARRGPGAGFSSPVPVTTGSTAVSEPAVGTAADGSGLVAWILAAPGSKRVQYRTVSAAGVLGPIRDASPGAVTVTSLAVDVNPAGHVGLTWVQDGAPWAATGSSSDGLDAGASLDPTASAVSGPQVALDDAGDAVFVWQREYGGPPHHLQVESRVQPTGGGLGPIVVHDGESADELAQSPSLAVTSEGRAVIAYGYQATAPATPEAIRYAVRNVAGGFANGTWSVSDVASQPGQVTFNGGSRVAFLPDGTITLIYLDDAGHLWAASRTGGGFGGHQQLSAGVSFRHDLAVGPSGVAAVVYSADGGTTGILNAAVRPAGATQFGPVREGADTQPFGSSGAVSIGVDGQGDAYALGAIRRCVGQADPCPGDYTSSVHLLTYDAAPPVLSGVAIPANAVAKRAVSFAASAEDIGSGAALLWDFGDGTKGTGAMAQHTYRKKGTYTATLAATDGVGNATTVTQKVTVLAPALPSKLGSRFNPGRKTTTVSKLSLKKLLADSKVTVTCKGKGCPVKSKSFKIRKKGGLSLTTLFRKPKVAKLAAKATLLVTVTAKKATGRFFSFTMLEGKPPVETSGCLTPGGKQFPC
jgi:PKD domain-containing protein